MDVTIAKWIIEFLLRQQVDEKIISDVIKSLPFDDNDCRLKKTMLLRRIETETSNGCVSETILGLLEIIEALDHEKGEMASDLMKEAYCLVAVDCTVRFLGYRVEENGKYMEVVESVWRNRVCVSKLVSEMSKNWMEDIELAGKNKSVCEKIWQKNTRNEALKAVKVYLKAEWEGLGPPFLVLMANKVGNEVGGFCLGGGGGVDSLELVSFEGSQKSPILARRKHVAMKSKRPRGAKISDADEEAIKKAGESTSEAVRAEDPTPPEVDRANKEKTSTSTEQPAVGVHPPDNVQTDQTLPSMEPISDNNVLKSDQARPKILESCETVKLQRALRKSRRILHAAVEDPLHEALQTAETLMSTAPNNTKDPVVEKVPEMAEKPVPDTAIDAEPLNHAEPETNIPNGSNEKEPENVKEDNINENVREVQKNERKRSLMEPNETCHTYQWSDDIENSSGSPVRVRPKLRSPKVQKTAPLKVPDYMNLKRRQKKKWTVKEEDTLREGVQKYGKGCWKAILLDPEFLKEFQGRTEVDLKDKWRNLTRYS